MPRCKRRIVRLPAAPSPAHRAPVEHRIASLRRFPRVRCAQGGVGPRRARGGGPPPRHCDRSTVNVARWPRRASRLSHGRHRRWPSSAEQVPDFCRGCPAGQHRPARSPQRTPSADAGKTRVSRQLVVFLAPAPRRPPIAGGHVAERFDKRCSAPPAWIFPAVIPASLAAQTGTIAGCAAATRSVMRRRRVVVPKRRSCFRGDGAFCSSPATEKSMKLTLRPSWHF